MTIDLEWHKMEPDELARWIAYRRAYGLAADRVERARFSADRTGRDRGAMLARLRAEMLRELGATDAGREHAEAIDQGVADAVEGRRPAW